MFMVMGLASCQPAHYREVYPAGQPQVEAVMLTQSVNYGEDSIAFSITITESATPLSQLHVKVLAGLTPVADEVIRTKDYLYEATLRYFVPFIAGMAEGEDIKVYLTATNIEGTETNVILDGCIGHRPAMETLYCMPPTINYTAIGKGQQMTYEEDRGLFALYDLGWPKSIEFLLCTKAKINFGRVDWTGNVFGMLNGEISKISEEQFLAGDATSIQYTDDNLETIDTIFFNPVTFELTISGKVAQPISTLDVENDLLEKPAYMSSSAAAQYRGAKIFFDPEVEVELIGVSDFNYAYNLDYMEPIGDGNKVRFLGEKGMYYVSYKIDADYIVVEPLYDEVYPNVMYMCGVGMGQPSKTPSATSGWGFDSPNQNFVARTIAPKVYQFTVYMLNDEENTDHPGFGSVNFKFFHQHGWGGEETSLDYTQSGLNIASSNEESNVGNWWSTSEPFEGIYRITLNQNLMTTTYEKIR